MVLKQNKIKENKIKGGGKRVTVSKFKVDLFGSANSIMRSLINLKPEFSGKSD